ncbi:DNA topoisomerase IB [Rhodalgimonas zhirmunskyi]|uniref:DNA topoisomerase n=1 Tax=Rhodalgimonas zhirmunskyi TaxID=2964767 RepID=A0AAJ1X6T3_9RHOB|nr:DNA topoisomerase IB [Rhodoalgimonas zhirmunskyi]MDQ2095524.1 DNA topoisomerase IB [Rhodoalgimonas zhirmunskyi]
MKDLPDLTYYPDDRPGISRRRCGRGFTYIAADGTRIERGKERRRIEALAVPPAYEGVWISPRVDGHLQATGRDARARKQYRYHPDWTAFRARAKYDQLADFGRALPRLRRAILAELRRSDPGDQPFALAAVLALLDRAAIRVGNRDYARENGSYGATTLKGAHMRLDGGVLRLRFTGKGGTKIKTELRDKTLERALSRLDDLPGAELITWLDEDGTPRGLRSDEVNAYLAERTGHAGLTAKTFRTWNGTVAALEAALACHRDAGRVTIKGMAEAAAERLHNTPTIARTSYIHPQVIALAEDETAVPDIRDAAPMIDGLRKAEAQLLFLLDGT